jgi:hypothetical protein
VSDWAESAEGHLAHGVAAGIVDVFVYVVLNLFVEYVPQVITETLRRPLPR